MSHTILVIEDQDDIAALARLILQGAGYTVLLAGSGEAGLRLLEEQQPVDLLLLDIMLPGIDGWEVCRRIRASSTRAALPILLFTVRSAKSYDERPEYALVNGMITKPFDRQDLLAMVASCVAS